MDTLIPTLETNGNDCWITTYKSEPTLPLGVGVDEIYRTDKSTLINLFFQTDPQVYKKEIKKTEVEKKDHQEFMNNVHDFLFDRTKKDMEYLRDYYNKRLADLEEDRGHVKS